MWPFRQERLRLLWLVVKGLWIFACILILFITLIYRGPEYRDAVEAEAMIMIALSYPMGWLFAYFCLGTIIGGAETTMRLLT
jgi:hypothetical protein